MKKFLCVGINHFALPGNDLAGCVPDARTMAAVAQGLGISPDTLTDKMATKKNAMNWLTQTVDAAKDGGVSYIGFSWSGHGTHYPRPEEADGLGEALVCADVAEKDGDWDPKTIIKDQELRDLLNQIPQTCVVEVWLDTCFSGGMDRAFLARHGSTTMPKFIHAPGNKVLRLANSSLSGGLNSNIVLWAASSEAQTSADAYIAGGPHGAFTYAWMKAFKGNQKKSRVQVLLDTRSWLAKNGYDQFPRLKCWNAAAQRMVGT